MWDMVGTVIGACRPVWVTGARLGYATFDAQLRKAFFVAIMRTGCKDTYIAYACLPMHKRTCTYSDKCISCGNTEKWALQRVAQK